MIVNVLFVIEKAAPGGHLLLIDRMCLKVKLREKILCVNTWELDPHLVTVYKICCLALYERILVKRITWRGS